MTSPRSPGATSSGSSAESPLTWELTVDDIRSAPVTPHVDRIVLDMLAPWECVPWVASALRPGGVLCSYVATTTQLAQLVETLRAHGGFTDPAASETLVRTWHVEGLAVRPDHRMVGHTGFLVTGRRLAPGVTLPRRRRRPAPGAYGEDYTGPRPAGGKSDGGKYRGGPDRRDPTSALRMNIGLRSDQNGHNSPSVRDVLPCGHDLSRTRI